MAVNVIVQARMGSKRLPGKVMMEMAGKPMIGHLLDELEMVRFAAAVIVIIPKGDLEGPLGNYLATRDCLVVAGPEEDVAERFRLALEQYPCEAFIRICADSPACWPNGIDELIESHNEMPGHYGQITGYPGTTAQICPTLQFLDALPTFTKEEREHVLTRWVRKFSFLVDTREDYERVKAEFEHA